MACTSTTSAAITRPSLRLRGNAFEEAICIPPVKIVEREHIALANAGIVAAVLEHPLHLGVVTPDMYCM